MSKVGWSGHAPTVKIGKVENKEKAKYEKVWSHEAYRKVAPGESAALLFLMHAKAKQGDTVIDFGCGTGRGAQKLKDAGLAVTGLDFAENCLDPGIDIDFQQADLTQPIEQKAQFGFCTDVMEHLPPEQVDDVLRNITEAVDVAFFQISCVDDVMGGLIGEPLHLTVQPYEWWKKRLTDLGCRIVWSEDLTDACQFLVATPNWKEATELLKNSDVRMNTAEEKVMDNIKANIEAGWTQVTPHEPQDIEVMILGGGPSLNDFEDEIREKREAGMPLITTNGAYHWCIERGIKPISAQIVVDARLHNKRFVSPVVDDCKYLIASQCDPSTFEGLPKDRTFMWHSANSKETLEKIQPFQEEKVVGITGGSTVMMRSVPLLRTLGFSRFHIYGMDSCFLNEEGHAYSQPENDQDLRLTVRANGKVFTCAPWMIYQAREFISLVESAGDAFKLAVYGDGLLATLLRDAAEA